MTEDNASRWRSMNEVWKKCARCGYQKWGHASTPGDIQLEGACEKFVKNNLEWLKDGK